MTNITPVFLEWIINCLVVGGVMIVFGCVVAFFVNSPIRRLKILEATLLVSLAAPICATLSFPFELPFKVLPSFYSDRGVAASTIVGESHDTPFIGVAEHQLASTPDRSVESHVLVGPDKIQWGRMDALLSVQIAAMILLGGVWILGIIAIHRTWKGARPEVMDPETGLGNVGRCIQLRSHTGISSPCAFGVFHWYILIPRDLMAEESRMARNLAIRHELSHLRRGDLWTWRLTRWASFFFWFHPAYWWLRREVRLCQDYLADSEASAECGTTRFAEFLVDYARKRQPVAPSLALSLFGRDSSLSKRVARLVHSDTPLETKITRLFLASLTLFSGFVLTAASVVRLESETVELGPVSSDATDALEQQPPVTKQSSEEVNLTQTPKVEQASDSQVSSSQIENSAFPTKRQYPYTFQFGQGFFPVNLESKERRVVIETVKFDEDWGDTLFRVENPGPGTVMIWNVRIEVLRVNSEDDSLRWETVTNAYPSNDWESIDIVSGSSVEVKKLPPQEQGTWRMVIAYQRKNLDPQTDSKTFQGDFEMVGPIIPELVF